jgi:hypothetical protein
MEIEGDYRERTIDVRRQVTQLNCVEFTLSAGWLVCGSVSASMQGYVLLGLIGTQLRSRSDTPPPHLLKDRTIRYIVSD